MVKGREVWGEALLADERKAGNLILKGQPILSRKKRYPSKERGSIERKILKKGKGTS